MKTAYKRITLEQRIVIEKSLALGHTRIHKLPLLSGVIKVL